MILVADIGGKFHYGQKPADGLVLIDWYERPDFTGTPRREYVPEERIKTAAAAGWVHEADLEELQTRINRINAQARKCGVGEVRFHGVGEELRPSKHVWDKELKGWKPTVIDRYVSVIVYGSAPRLPGGWRLNAVVDYRQSIPLVSMVPGEELPFDPRDRGATCDHCKTARQRAEVFVLVNDAGQGCQVGRQCLADFLGSHATNPASALGFWSRLRSLLGFDDEDRAERGFRGARGFYTEEVMVLSAAIVNVSGWVSRARSEASGLPSTSQRIQNYCHPPRFQYDCPAKAEYEAWRAEVSAQMAGDAWKPLLAEAREARAWWQAKGSAQGAQEFDRELGDISRCDWLQDKYLGRAAYLLPGFRKEQDRLKEAARRETRWAHSVHVGQPKQRLEMELELVSTQLIDGDYGTTTLATFDDGRGNQVKWFASNFPEWPVGEKRAVKATVKAHEDWKGTKQTLVTRVS